MKPRQREFGTNRDMAHSNQRPARAREISDAALLRDAKRAAAKWQTSLAKTRRAQS